MSRSAKADMQQKPKPQGTMVMDWAKKPATSGEGSTVVGDRTSAVDVDPMKATALAAVAPAPMTPAPLHTPPPQQASGTIVMAPQQEGAGALVGKLLVGKYKINRLLGEGGMGAVYEGEHVEIGKRVAVKLVHATFGKHSEIAERFKREARAASAVESEHIVQVFDVGLDEAAGLFMVMELLRGRDLGSHIESNGALEPLVACGVAAQAASALDAAHAAGIVHRDLKPPNVFLVAKSDGSAMVKLVDFGVAKVVRDAQAGGVGLTRMGSALGTPQYMSPEQAQGLPSVDHRTDIYALGAVLYEAIAGQPAFAALATYEQVLIAIVTQPTPRLSSVVPDVPPELDDLVASMMAKDPSARPQTMAAVVDRLFAIFPDLAEMRLVVPGLEADGARGARGAATGTRPAARRAMASVGRATPPTRSAVALDAIPEPKRGGASKVVAFVAIGAIALLGGAALAMKFRPQAAPTSASAPAAASVAPPPATASATSTVVVTPVEAKPSATPPASATPSVAPPVTKGKVPAYAKPQPPSAKQPPEKPPTTTGAKVGGAGVSDQF